MFIKRSLIIGLLCLWAISSYAQTYNPYVSLGDINPKPLLPAEFNGTGTISFSVGNSGTSILPFIVNQEMTLVLTLANGVPDNVNPINALNGAWVAYFNWFYDPAISTYFAIQNQDIPANDSGIITIDYKVTGNTPLSVSGNGFNLNLQPPPYANGTNSTTDDATNGYTYVRATDYGDAPLTYGSAGAEINLFKNAGGNYINFVMLGDTIDHETGYLGSALADGDDNSGINDEDGVTFPVLIQGTTVTIPVLTTVQGGTFHFLNAWIDWNGDGDFNDTGEQIATNVLAFSTQTTNLTVNIPVNALSGNTFARFRFGAIAGPSGFATYGEVEDYMINIIASAPSIDLVKTGTYQDLAPLGIYNAGDQISYTFSVTNTGNVPLTNVVVADPKVSVTGGPIAVLNPGQTDNTTFTAIYTLTQDDIDAGIFTNTAIASGTFAGLPVTDSDDDIQSFIRTPSISIVKSALPQTYSAVGEVITYSFMVTNTGNVTLTDVGVSDPLSGLSVIAPAPVTLAPMQSQLFTATYAITQADLDNGSVLNTATASGTPPTGPNVTATDSEAITANQTPSISIVKSALPQTYSAVGEVITYSFMVTNTGNVTLTNVGVGDPLSGLSVIAPAPLTLAPAQSQLFTATYTITQADLDNGSVLNTATASGTPPTGPNVTATDSEAITANQTPEIALLKSGTWNDANNDGYAQPGETITYSFTVTNTGNVTVTNLLINDTRIGATNLIVTPSSLAPGAIGTATYNYTVTQADIDDGGVYNIAVVSGKDPKGGDVTDVSEDPNPLDPNDPKFDPNCPDCTYTGLPQNPGIQIVKTSTNNPKRYSYVGDILTYDLVVTNTGNVTLTNVVVNDPKAVVAGSPITTLAPGLSVTLTASYVVIQADLDNGQFVNTATATGNYTDANGAPQTVSDDDIETIIAVIPDVTPVITAIPNVMQGITEFNLTVRITELNMINTKGLITVKIPKEVRLSFKNPYNPALTILGSVPLNNANWAFSEDATHYIFSSTTVIPAGSFSTFGFIAQFDPANTKGIYTLTSQIISGSGGEVRINNNVDSEKIDYFIE